MKNYSQKAGNLCIRNFVIISHVNHGKSTLADRLLELTNTVPKEKMKAQYLDMMDLERERGVTIKMAPVRMEWENFLLNLIDTPGHVDFSYEVSRSLKAVEGALLLVDASKGIQAQTLFNLEMVRKENLVIIPIINKIDLAHAKISETENELLNLGFKKEEILKISAKTGEKLKEVLEQIVQKIPAPAGDSQTPLKALIFDSVYDQFKGAVTYVRIFDGEIKKNDKIKLLLGQTETEVLEVGYFKPEFKESDKLKAGEIGYLKTGIKNIAKTKIGDTISSPSSPTTAYLGYQQPQSVVYASIYPQNGEDFEKLKKALLKLQLNDASLYFKEERSKTFGAGFKCGFLGMFHLEITKERINREFKIDIVITRPAVDIQKLDSGFKEPYVRLKIITPHEFLGKIMELCRLHRARVLETSYLDKRLILICEAPLSEIIIDFYDELKNISTGYASMNYELLGFREANLVELNILINQEKIEPLSQIVAKEKVESVGRSLIKKIKEVMPRHLFELTIQAAIGNRIIASGKVPPLRKDVTGYLYGGDVTRKRKLLEKQARGKKRMKQFGKVTLPSDIFLKISSK